MLPGVVPKGKNLCHDTHDPEHAINIVLGGKGGGTAVHLTLVDVVVMKDYLKVVAKFFPSTDGHAHFSYQGSRSSVYTRTRTNTDNKQSMSMTYTADDLARIFWNGECRTRWRMILPVTARLGVARQG